VWRFFNELLITRNLLREFLSIYSVCIWMFNCLQYLTTALVYSFFTSLVMLKSKRIEDRVCSLVMWFFFLLSMIWEMDGIPSIIFLFCNTLLLTRYGSSYPLCTDLSECFLCIIYSSFFFFHFGLLLNSNDFALIMIIFILFFDSDLFLLLNQGLPLSRNHLLLSVNTVEVFAVTPLKMLSCRNSLNHWMFLVMAVLLFWNQHSAQ